MKPFNKKIVEIEWYDSCASGGWRDGYRADAMECRTVGYLLHRDKKTICVAQCLADNDDNGERFTIPTPCVKRVRKLK